MSKQYDYDVIYGVSLGDYLNRQNKSVDQLISEINTDILILQENYDRYAARNYELTDEELSIASQIMNTIKKKKKHLKRIKRWRNSKA